MANPWRNEETYILCTHPQATTQFVSCRLVLQ
jgi:hypothetical protein